MFLKIFNKSAIIVPTKYISHAQKSVAYVFKPIKFNFKLSTIDSVFCLRATIAWHARHSVYTLQADLHTFHLCVGQFFDSFRDSEWNKEPWVNDKIWRRPWRIENNDHNHWPNGNFHPSNRLYDASRFCINGLRPGDTSEPGILQKYNRAAAFA